MALEVWTLANYNVHMRNITVPSSAVALRSDKPLTPAMVSAVWEIAGALDEARIPAEVPNAVWLEIATARLRGEGSRSDNVWLRECLDRLTGVKLSGEYRGDPWGAVVLAEWRIEQGGTMARLLIPPAGVHALRAPANFTKIEAYAAHRLTGHARRLYAILADKKRLGRPSWKFTIEELRALLGVDAQRSYDVWGQFRKRVLLPAVEGINDYGTVEVKMTPERHGRAVKWVRFDWNWKDPHAVTETAGESDRHSKARRKSQDTDDAPPMIEDQREAAHTWWNSLPENERQTWADKVGRQVEIGGVMQNRPERIIRELAFEASGQLAQ